MLFNLSFSNFLLTGSLPVKDNRTHYNMEWSIKPYSKSIEKWSSQGHKWKLRSSLLAKPSSNLPKKKEEKQKQVKAVKYLLERLCFETPSMILNGFMHNNRTKTWLQYTAKNHTETALIAEHFKPSDIDKSWAEREPNNPTWEKHSKNTLNARHRKHSEAERDYSPRFVYETVNQN